MKSLLSLVFLFFLAGLLSCGKDTGKDDIKSWFNQGAEDCDLTKPLHLCSQWHQRTEKQWDEMVTDTISKLDPPLKDHEKIFDLGVGVGAAMQPLLKHYKGLWIGGSDLAEKAIGVAKKVFPSQADHFIVHDMTKKHENIPDGFFDHVVSFGALAMYLPRDKMLVAIKEALRMTKPGGSLVITSFMEPGTKGVEYVTDPVEKSYWTGRLEKLGCENVKIYNMKHQGLRYQIACTKN